MLHLYSVVHNMFCSTVPRPLAALSNSKRLLRCSLPCTAGNRGNNLSYINRISISASGTVTHTVDYTSCQQLHNIAMSAADGQIGGFIPECTPDGNFKSAQCHALTGFCWCVNHVGVRIIGTEERYKEPRCDGE